MSNLSPVDGSRKDIPHQVGVRWGEFGAPLLPKPLRDVWGQDPLPNWVCSDLGLPPGSTCSMLGDEVRPPPEPALERVRRYLALLLKSRRADVGMLPAVGEPWPAGVEFTEIPLTMRTHNCIAARGLNRNLRELPYLTFEDLLHLRGMGPLSVLEFACTLESATRRAQTAHIAWQGPEKSEQGDAPMPGTLLEVLEEPWTDWISEADPRFSALLPPGRGTIAERAEELITNPAAQRTGFASLEACLPQIRARLSDLERIPLETLLAEYLESVTRVGDRRLLALIARLNWGGAPRGITLEEAGKTAGLTRERLRQLQARFEERRPSHPVIMPALDKALEFLKSRVPLAAQEAAEALVTVGLAERPFHPASLIAAARDCGRSPALHIEEARGIDLVVSLPSGQEADRVARVAYRQARACGASNISEVAAEIEARGPTAVDEGRVLDLLRTFSDVEFLTADWFWRPSRANDAVWKMSRRVLAATSPIDVARLREGLRRSFRFRQSMARKKGALLMVPPRSVLLAYYKAHPDFVVLENELVKSARPLDYRSELTPLEQSIVDVLRSTPSSVLDRVAMAEGCIERGVNTHSLWTMMTYSPVFESLGDGLWTVRGTRVDPVAVEAIRTSNQLRPRERRVLDFGWGEDGRLWVAIRLPADLQTQVFGIPADARRYLVDRDFRAESEDGTQCGRVRIYSSGTSTGYAEFLRRSGADEGDIMLAQFNLVTGIVSLGLIDDEDLEELSPAA